MGYKTAVPGGETSVADVCGSVLISAIFLRGVASLCYTRNVHLVLRRTARSGQRYGVMIPLQITYSTQRERVSEVIVVEKVQ